LGWKDSKKSSKEKRLLSRNIFEPNEVICNIGVHKRRTLGLNETDDIRKKSRWDHLMT
jgi:hypothetical protein